MTPREAMLRATVQEKAAMFEWLREIALGDSEHARKAAIAMLELNKCAAIRAEAERLPAGSAPERKEMARLREALAGLIQEVHNVAEQEKWPDPEQHDSIIKARAALAATRLEPPRDSFAAAYCNGCEEN